jgi:phage shock protein A
MAPEPAKPARAKVEKPTTSRSELTALQTKLAEVEGRLDTLQRQQQSRKALEQYARQLSDDGAGGAKSKSAKGPIPSSVDAEDPVFELAVRSVLDRVDWERDEEQRLVRAQRRSEQANRQTELLTERLSLTPDQAKRVAQALTEQMDRFRALREGNGENGDGQKRPATRSEWRERVDGIRDETEKNLSGILDDRQLEGYRAFVENEGFAGPSGLGRRGRLLRAGSAPSSQ